MLKHQEQRKRTVLWLTFVLGVYLCFSPLPAADGFIAYDHFLFKVRGNLNNLIRRVHKDQWTIGYVYVDNCPPEKRKNGKAIEEAITTSLRAWLQPVRELNTGQPVVDDFRYVPNLVFPLPDAELKLYDLTIGFFCDFGRSRAWVIADDAKPPHIELHRGTVVDRSFTGALHHEIGHCFGLSDTYLRPELTLEELRVSRGGLAKTIGHQPASVMNGVNMPPPVPTRISQDDANGIVWLYKFYHEDLALEDCAFPDYELEKSPDGCRPKYPLIFELRHNGEGFGLAVIRDDENTDINAKDGDGMTALHHAVIKRYPKLVDKLLSYEGIEVNIKDKSGMTALQYAMLKKYLALAIMLLLHKDIEVNNDIDVNITDEQGMTMLHHAVIQKDQNVVEVLLGYEDIDFNITDERGRTVLHQVVWQRDQNLLEVLLAHKGVDVTIRDGQGRTPLQLASRLGYNELVDLISAHIEARRVRVKNSLATVWGALKVR